MPQASKEERATYARERYRAIRDGTWNPRPKTPDRIREPTAEEIAWTAGFLEGDGSFRADHTTHCVRADQINREPLGALQEMWGGHLNKRGPLTSSGNVVWRWGVNGERARTLMRAVYPHMSTLKQSQIDKALAAHKIRGPGANNREKTHCPRGHPYDEANTIYQTKLDARMSRKCRECARMHVRELRERRRSANRNRDVPLGL